MFLEYGVDDHGDLIRIDQVARGRLSGVYCPYCHRPLLARKGEIKAPHFAHDGETCQAANRSTEAISLPVYDRFLLHLTGRELQALQYYQGLENEWDSKGRESYTLQEKNLLAHDQWQGGDLKPTKLGKIPLGELSLMLFNDEQEPMIRERYKTLQEIAFQVLGTPDFETALIDLQLYRAQWRRILGLTLYFMAISYAGGELYKIGVTSRSAEERAIELAADLRPHLGDVAVEVLQTWPHRGNVELYFKHRYAAHQHRLGDLTEYFKFDDTKPVLRDLRRMHPKVLDADEQAILDDTPSDFERGIIPIGKRKLSLEAWLMLEKYSDSTEPIVWAGFSGGKDYGELYSLGLAGTEYPRTSTPVNKINSRGRAFRTHFSTFYHEYFHDHYEAEERTRRAEQRRVAIQEGMKQAAGQGKHIGRPTEDDVAFLEKPQNKAIRAALERGLSLRETARETEAAINTIRKVKALLENERIIP